MSFPCIRTHVRSFGVRIPDGKKISYKESPETYLPQGVKSEQVVGCGVDWISKHVFFTLDGKYMDVAFQITSHTFYPTVCIPNSIDGDTVHINLGQAPFAFDIEAFIKVHAS